LPEKVPQKISLKILQPRFSRNLTNLVELFERATIMLSCKAQDTRMFRLEGHLRRQHVAKASSQAPGACIVR